MTKKISMVRSVTLVMAATVVSRLLGFVREAATAAKFGASAVTDAYFFAVAIPLMVFATAGTALSTTFIPLFNDRVEKKSKEEAFDFANNIINLFVILLIAISGLGILLAPAIVKLTRFTGETYDVAVTLVRILFPMIVFTGLSEIMSGILNALGIFSIPAFKGVPYNLIIISFLVAFSSVFGIYGLAVATVLATFSDIVIQLPPLIKSGFVYKFRVNFTDKILRRQMILVFPVLIGTAAEQLNTLVDRVLGSYLPGGSISALNYANRLNVFVIGIFVNSVTTVVYTKLTRLSAKDDTKAFSHSLMDVTRFMIFFALPVAVGGALLSDSLVRIAYERGEFSAKATQLTSSAFFYYVLGMIGFSLRHVLSRAFYALKDTRTPVKNGIIAIVINIVLNLILIGPMQHRGLALATSIAATVTAFLLLYNFHKKLKEFDLKSIMFFFLKTAAGTAVMGVCVWWAKRALLGSSLNSLEYLGMTLLLILMGIAVYIAAAYLLRIREVKTAIDLIKNRRRGE